MFTSFRRNFYYKLRYKFRRKYDWKKDMHPNFIGAGGLRRFIGLELDRLLAGESLDLIKPRIEQLDVLHRESTSLARANNISEALAAVWETAQKTAWDSSGYDQQQSIFEVQRIMNDPANYRINAEELVYHPATQELLPENTPIESIYFAFLFDTTSEEEEFIIPRSALYDTQEENGLWQQLNKYQSDWINVQSTMSTSGIIVLLLEYSQRQAPKPPNYRTFIMPGATLTKIHIEESL